ncbi:hypothetical protein BpHYR1_009861 [Brachionus plicatilis]|uniref:Uncharacterized protein n=1 Tax=Brachionus plicatilis TaxID=10195 RepID=A0A3M7SEM0_BRAPC|nr:hypothetical protein BpHYR1_009861 [Brachionus plicatilis]
MSSTLAIAPIPESPHIKTFSIEGCWYIKVFMAGQMITGLALMFSISHARITLVNKLSHIPLLILARLFAPRGAIRKTSAHFLSSM